MPDALQIRASLTKFLDGTVSLAEFEDWFVLQTWNIHLSRDSSAEGLVDDIEMFISEYTSGQLSEPELRHSLLSLISQDEAASSPGRLLITSRR